MPSRNNVIRLTKSILVFWIAFFIASAFAYSPNSPVSKVPTAKAAGEWTFIGSRGSANNKVSGTTISMNPNSNIASGRVAVVRAVSDNTQTTDGVTTLHTISDSKGNSWTKVNEYTDGNGAAAAGITVSLWASKITNAILTSDTITLTLGSSVTAKAITAAEFSLASGYTFTLAGASGTAGTGTNSSVTLGSLDSSEYLFLSALGVEGPSTDTFTQDTDYTSATSDGTTGSTNNTNVTLRGGYRVFTGTGDTYDPSYLGNSDLRFVAANFANGATVTIPTSQQDDIVIVGAFKNSTTAPTNPSGWTVIGATSSGNGTSLTISRKIMTASPDTSVTFTGATNTIALVYRGVNTTTPTGATSTHSNTNANSIQYPALGTFTDTGGSSFVVGIGGHIGTINNITNVATVLDNFLQSSGRSQALDTGNGVTSYAAETVTVASTTARARGGTFELRGANIANRDWAIAFGALKAVQEFTISGTCKQADNTTNCADGQTIKYAVNGVAQAAAGTTSSGAFTIQANTLSSGDVVHIWVDNVADSQEAIAVTKYDGSGNISGVELIAGSLSIGSNDNQTITVANISLYDNSVSGDEDIFFRYYASFSVCGSFNATGLCVDPLSQFSNSDKIYVKSGNIFQPEASVAVGKMEVLGTFNAGTYIHRLTGVGTGTSRPFIVSGTFNPSTSSLYYLGDGDVTVESGNYGSLYLIPSITSTRNYTTNGAVTVSDVFGVGPNGGGQSRNLNFTLGGTATAGQSYMYYTSGGTTTFSTGSDYSFSVTNTFTVSGGTFNANGSVLSFGALSLTDGGAGSTFNANSSTITLTGSGTPLSIATTFNAGTSTVKYVSTSATNIAAASYNHLELKPTGSSPTYTLGTASSQTITVTGNMSIGDGVNGVTVSTTANSPDLTISGDLTLGANTTLSGSGSGTITVGSSPSCNSNPCTINLTGGTFKLRGTNTSVTIGSNSSTISWTFNNLTLSNSNGSARTVTAGSGGGTVTVSGVLTVGEAGDTTTTQFNAGSLTVVLTGSGTPFVLTASKGTFASSTSTVRYTGTSATNIATTDYKNLELQPAGTVTYTMGTACCNGNMTIWNWTIGNGTNALTVTNDTNDLLINIISSMTINANATYTKQSSGSIYFRNNGGAGTTFTDNTASKQDLGSVSISSNATNTTLSLGSSMKVTSMAIDASQALNMNGSNTLTITGSGTVFTNSGTFTQSTSTVEYTGTTANVAAVTYHNLLLGGTGTYTMPATDLTINGNLSITTGATITKGAGTVRFGGSWFNTWTDNTASKQDIGNVQITGSSTSVSLGSDVKLTSLTIDATTSLTQGAYNITTTGSGTVITVNGTWTNTSTGDIVLSGDVSNAGTITLNSNNGSQCVDGTNDIVITSSVGGVQRTWSGAGTFNLYNLSVTDMAGSVMAYNSTLTNTTWTAGSCPITISGTLYSTNEASTVNTNGTSVKLSVAGSAAYSTTTSGSNGTWSFTGVTAPSAGDIITIWMDIGATTGSSNATLVFRYGSSCTSYPNCTGLSLFQRRIILDSKDGNAITNANLASCDNDTGSACSDTDIGFTSESGTLTTTWTTADSNILRLKDSTANFVPGGNVVAKNFNQSAGTFDGGIYSLDLNGGGLTVSGGTFTTGSAGTFIEGSLSVTGGSFNNSNTITIDGSGVAGTTITCTSLPGTLAITRSAGSPAAAITIASGCSVSLGASPTTTLATDNAADITINGTVTVASGTWTINVDSANSLQNPSVIVGSGGTITHNGSGWDINDVSLENLSGGTITYSGTALSIERNFTQSGTFNMTGKTVTLDGTADGSIVTCTNLGGTLVISKSAGSGASTITITSGCSASLGASPTTTLAADSVADFTINGTVIVDSGTWTIQNATVNSTQNPSVIVGSGGTITHNGSGWDINDVSLENLSGGTITYSGTALNIERNFTQSGTFISSGLVVTLDSNNNVDDTNLICAGTWTGSITLNKFEAGAVTVLVDNCTIPGDFTRTDGVINNPASPFSLIVQGNFSSSTTDAFGGPNMTVEFGGSNAQTITQNATPSTNTSPFVINKTNNSDTVTLASNLVLGSTLTITKGILSQGATFNLTTGGALSVGANGTWSNTGTGDVVLGGDVSNAGTITLNSNNGSQCVDGANDIVITSSVGGVQRTWSGAGTFNIYNVSATDQAGSITVYNSTLSNSTWTNLTGCGVTISGTTNGSDGITVRFAVNGSLQAQTATTGSGTWSISGATGVTTSGQVIVIWFDGVADSAESTAVAKYDGTGDITGIVLNTNVLSIGSVDDQTLTLADLDTYDCANDEDVMYRVNSSILEVEGLSTCAGSVSNSYSNETLQIESGDTLTVGTETITTSSLTVTGTLTLAASTVNLTGSGTPFTGSGNFTSGSSTVVYSSTSATNIRATTYYHLSLTPAGTVTYTLGTATSQTLTVGGNLTVGNGTNALTATAETYDPAINVTGNTVVASSSIMRSGTTAWSLNGDLTVNGTLTGGDPLTATVSGNVSGSGIINIGAGGAFTHRVYGNKGFGSSSGSNNWTFNNLVFSNSSVGTPLTVTAQSGGSGKIVVNGVLYIGSAGDSSGATTTLDAGNRTWDLLGIGGSNVIQILGSPAGVFSANTSTINYESSGINKPIAPVTYYNLGIDPTSDALGSTTFTLGGNIVVQNTLTIGNASSTNVDTLSTSASNYSITSANINITSKGTLTANGSTITLTGSGNPLTITGAFNAGTSTVQYKGTSATNINAITYNNLSLNPASGTPTYTLGVGTFTVKHLTMGGGGSNVTITAAANNPSFNITGDLSINPGVTYTKGNGTLTFRKGGEQTWGDYSTSSPQDIGRVVISANVTNTTVTASSDQWSVKATSLTVDAGQTFATSDLSFMYIYITGSGTGASRPVIINGVYNIGTQGAQLNYTGQTATTDVENAAFGELVLDAAASNVTYVLPATLDISASGYVYSGRVVAEQGILDAATNNSQITIKNTLALGTNATFTKGATSKIILKACDNNVCGFKPYLYDNNSTRSDFGAVQISAGTGVNTTANLRTEDDDASKNIKLTSLIVDANQTLDLYSDYSGGVYGTSNMIVTGNGSPITNNGTITVNTGTVEFAPSATTGVTLPNLNYYILKLNKASNTFTAPAILNVSNTLEVTAGTLDLNTNDPELDTLHFVNTGTTLASATSPMTVRDSFTSNGTFTHNNGTVQADSTTTNFYVSTDSAVTFYNFKVETPGAHVRFKQNGTYGIAGTLTLTGVTGNPIWVDSQTDGMQWSINLSGNATTAFMLLKNAGCHASSLNITLHETVQNLGNMASCWIFKNFGAGSSNGPTGGGAGGSGATGGATGGGAGGSGATGGNSGGTSSLPEIFTASDGVALGTYSSYWTVTYGGFTINTNAITSSTSGMNIAKWTGSLFGSDQYAEMKFSNVGGLAYLGVAVRIQENGDAYAALCGALGAQLLKVYGNGTSDDLGTVGISCATNDTIRLTATGSTLTFTKNGAVITIITNNSLTGGTPGLGGLFSSTIIRGDDWTAGSASGGGGGGGSP